MIKLPNYKKLIPNILEFDVIRIQKLLHMAQDAVITGIFCFFIGMGLNNLLPSHEHENIGITGVMVMLELIIIVLSIYYIRKLTELIPFFLRFTNNYNPFHKSSKGVGLIGTTIAMGLFLMATQSNMKKRIIKLKSYFTKNLEEDDYPGMRMLSMDI